MGLTRDYKEATQGGYGLDGDINKKGWLLGPSNSANLKEPWFIIVRGPAGSPYEGRMFRFAVTVRSNYPFGPAENSPRLHCFPGTAAPADGESGLNPIGQGDG